MLHVNSVNQIKFISGFEICVKKEEEEERRRKVKITRLLHELRLNWNHIPDRIVSLLTHEHFLIASV